MINANGELLHRIISSRMKREIEKEISDFEKKKNNQWTGQLCVVATEQMIVRVLGFWAICRPYIWLGQSYDHHVVALFMQ